MVLFFSLVVFFNIRVSSSSSPFVHIPCSCSVSMNPCLSSFPCERIFSWWLLLQGFNFLNFFYALRWSLKCTWISSSSFAGVGKSCLLLRFSDDTFTTSFITTIGYVCEGKSFVFGRKICMYVLRLVGVVVTPLLLLRSGLYLLCQFVIMKPCFCIWKLP